MPDSGSAQTAFLTSPMTKIESPTKRFSQRQAIRAMVGELRHDVAVVQDRPGDQMREKRNEQHIVQKVTVPGDAGFAVDQVADLGEREKRDAQRQDDRIDRLNGGNEMTDEADDGEQVFVIEQGGEIECDSGGGDPGLQAGSRLGAQDQPGDGIIGADRNQQQDDEGGVSTSHRTPATRRSARGRRRCARLWRRGKIRSARWAGTRR